MLQHLNFVVSREHVGDYGVNNVLSVHEHGEIQHRCGFSRDLINHGGGAGTADG